MGQASPSVTSKNNPFVSIGKNRAFFVGNRYRTADLSLIHASRVGSLTDQRDLEIGPAPVIAKVECERKAQEARFVLPQQNVGVRTSEEALLQDTYVMHLV